MKPTNKQKAEKTENLKPILKLGDEKLEQVVGGSGSRQPGLTCPGCLGFIPASMEELNTAPSITCPTCKNTYQLNHQVSHSPIDALMKFKNK